MQIKGCTRATRKLRATTRICKCECEMHCLVACRMLESNTTGWSFCKNPSPTPTLNTSTWSIKANWGLKWHKTGPWAMSFLDSTKALSCESFHWKGTSLWVNFLKALTTSLKFGQNLARKFSIRQTENCFYYGWGWADPFRVKLESRKNHFWGFRPLPGWVQLEFLLLHSQQEIVKILIMIFFGLLLCYSTSIFKNRPTMLQRSFIPARASCCLVWYSSFRWRLARADVTTSTCQKECERLWLSFISDLKYVGETRYRISYHKIICTIQLWQNVLKTGNLPFRRSISRVMSRDFCCKQTAKVRTLGQLPTTRVRTSTFCCR